jgi:hypothetical protein
MIISFFVGILKTSGFVPEVFSFGESGNIISPFCYKTSILLLIFCTLAELGPLKLEPSSPLTAHAVVGDFVFAGITGETFAADVAAGLSFGDDGVADFAMIDGFEKVFECLIAFAIRHSKFSVLIRYFQGRHYYPPTDS